MGAWKCLALSQVRNAGDVRPVPARAILPDNVCAAALVLLAYAHTLVSCVL